MIRRSVVLGVTAALLAACGAFEAESESPAPGPTADAGAGGIDAPAACRPAFADDFAGCACSGAQVRDCSHGFAAGGASACGKGTQRCEGGTWAPCIPVGTQPLDPPSKAELCFDARDDDCDGKLDDGCPGSGDVDLCMDKGAIRPVLAAFTDKATYKRGEIVQLFVVWKAGTISSVHLSRSGAYCAGGAGGQLFPADAGPGCAGWSAVRRTIETGNITFLPTGSVTLDVHVNPAATPACTGEAAKTTVTFTVTE